MLLSLGIIFVIPVSFAYAQSQGHSQLTVISQDTNGRTISGYYTLSSDIPSDQILPFVLSTNAHSTADFPLTLALVSGRPYLIEANDYGSCHFDHWADAGSKNSSRSIAISGDTQMTAVYDGCAAGTPPASVTVQSVNQNGNPIYGYYAWVLQGGTVLHSGFTTMTFGGLSSGAQYTIQVDDYGSCHFNHWQDDSGNTNRQRSFAGDQLPETLTAVFNCEPTNSRGGSSGGGSNSGGGAGTITVYAHRVPSSYWDACFATTCSAGTGPGTGMYFVLSDSTGAVVKTGFADENGLIFSGLDPHATYYLMPTDCNSCHNSNHDVIFDHWGDGTNTRPRAVAAGSSLDAWFAYVQH